MLNMQAVWGKPTVPSVLGHCWLGWHEGPAGLKILL